MAPLVGTKRSPSHSARKPVLVLRLNPTLHPLETRVGNVGALASVRWPYGRRALAVSPKSTNGSGFASFRISSSGIDGSTFSTRQEPEGFAA